MSIDQMMDNMGMGNGQGHAGAPDLKKVEIKK